MTPTRTPHPTRARRPSVVAAGLAAAAAVALPAAACATDDAPRPPSTTASPTTSPDGTPSASSPAAADPAAAVRGRLAALEEERDARLGVYAVDTGTGRSVAYRGGERFAYASTIKALAAGAVLDDLSRPELRERVRWTEEDLVEYSPVTELHVEDGLTVRQLIDAAITVSDNTAGNLLFDLVGGPGALDAALVDDVGDRTTEVVRREPDLNTAVPGDPRDTTTPRALATSLGRYVLGDVLPAADRRLLEATMRRTETGDALIRAGVPQGWRVGDKTGSAGYGTRNDVAVVRPPGGDPVLVAVMTTHDEADAATDDALVADATRVVVDALGS
ncbi:class A beta-lactamase [Nocardioides sp. AX2bis]|uniref:class A beta-lactamase n=1 Tax=Nocardioides sp. AX2bis TaxID=2653157 RepID=UPI00135CE56B|nr:class A beta-lactamase [Nocardioides sp. AX2bis]